MKRIILILSVLLFASCTDSSYRGSVNYTISGYEPYPVLVSVGTVVDTKGMGPVETQDKWLDEDADIFLYAFRNDVRDFSVKSTADNTMCLMDGSSVMNRFAKGGRHATVTKDDHFIIWDDDVEPPYFPSGTEPYVFYGYYVDDCTISDSRIIRDASSVRIPLTIDGSQDIMSARSEIRDALFDGKGFTDGEIQSIRRRAYSAYTSNRDIHPAVYFYHQLSRISFEAYPARKEAARVCIQKIVVKSYNDAYFTVVHTDASKIGLDFSQDNTMYDFYLKEEDVSAELRKDYYQLEWKENYENVPLYERPGLKIGGSLLLPPVESYEAVIHVKETNGGRTHDYELPITIRSGQGSFRAGKQYMVRIAVYGQMTVEAEVELEGWEPGDDYYYDEEIFNNQ